ncbi:hypothetical protein [Nonomuraea sp. NPDC049695]|uniref:hypothetical protein n=1 Tax=Nonomuraea sp. NPDC049695 TaxID=3154734 RepID=UPI00343A8FE2
MIKVMTADGTEARAVDEGQGPIVLVLHPGLDDGSSWREVAARLTARHRVVRLHRRRYRLDIGGASCTVAQEVEHVLAVVAALERVMPRVERVVLRGQGHAAQVKAPGQVAAVIDAFAAEVLDQAGR